jgi:TonB family protein
MTKNSLAAGAGSPPVESAPANLRQLNPAFDRFEARDFGSLAASLVLHFIILMGLWATTHTPQPPKPVLIDVEIIQAEPIQVAGKATPTKATKLARESKSRQRPPKPKQQKAPQDQHAVPEMREYEMDATVVKAGKRGAKSRKLAGKVALPDVSRPVGIDSRAVPGQAPEQTTGAGLQQSEQQGSLKPRLSSLGQQASSRMQSPARAGVESENGPRLIASNAPAAQTLTPEYRHSSRPGGQYSSQGGAAQPAMGGGPASEAAQPYSLQSSTLAGRPAGNPAAPRNAVAQGGAGARGVNPLSGAAPVGTAAARGAGMDASAPTEILSSGGQGQVAAAGAPVNPLQISSSGGTGSKAAVAGPAASGSGSSGRTSGGDASQPGGRGGSQGMDEGSGQGQLASSASAGRAVGPARSMSAAIIPEGGGGSTVRPADASSAAPMQRVEAQAVAQVITDRYASRELKASSPKSVCELPLMMAGFDRKPLPEGLASIMGSESAMIMESPPVLLPGNVQPNYPAAAMFTRQQGKVVVRAQVLANGQVGEAFLRQSTGAPVLDQAALATVRSWRFKPATRNGQPVPAWVNVPIEYRNPS